MLTVNNYASWGDYAVTYDSQKNTFFIDCKDNKKAIYNLRVTDILVDGNSIGDLSVYEKCSVSTKDSKDGKSTSLKVKFSKSTVLSENLTICFNISYTYIDVKVVCGQNGVVCFEGEVCFGDRGHENTYPMSSSAKGNNVVNCAYGPASSDKDNMLFDRITDTAIKFNGGENTNIKFNWDVKKYILSTKISFGSKSKKMRISVVDRILTDKYNIDYGTINKNRVFSKPPVGWMTWYAVKFDACEEKVLKNAKWMSENLKDYGADSVWVDWEWGHNDFSGSRSDGADNFNPDKEKYPHGLKYVADKIKQMGLVPALWIGFTVDSDMNEYLKENPEIILVDDAKWCGRYFYDFSHPKYLNEFLPKALANVKEWGYESVKYDVLPMAMTMHEKYHSRMYNPSLTTKQAYRQMIEKTRKELGESFYMLSCSGGFSDRCPIWACDIFDAARIGEDIFEWGDFLSRGIDRTLEFYPLHNNVMYLDSDNVVMREEFNNIKQAASRIYFVSTLGMPVTFGDEFDALDNKRVDFIKSCLPVLDIHPTSLFVPTRNKNGYLKINLAVNKEWESYNVLNVFNVKDDKNGVRVDLQKDLSLSNDDYLVFDYTSDKFVGVINQSFDVELDGCESKIFSIRKKLIIPQIISTSRHISQGAFEIKIVNWCDDCNTLTVESEVIANVPYTVTLYVPDGFTPDSNMEFVQKNVYRITIKSDKNCVETIACKFNKK